MSIAHEVQVEIDKIYVERAQHSGLNIWTGADAKITNAIVKDMIGQPDNLAYGHGIIIDEGTKAELSQILIIKGRDVAFNVSDPETDVFVEDIVILDTQPSLANKRGEGVLLYAEASLEMHRGVIRNSRYYGISIPEKTNSAFKDVYIIETAPEIIEPNKAGIGIRIKEGAEVNLQRIHLENNSMAGIHILEPETNVTMSDITILGTRWDSTYFNGSGITIEQSASTTFSKGLIESNHGAGIILHDNATLNADNITITNTICDENLDPCVGGLSAQKNSSLTLKKSIIKNNDKFGLNIIQDSNAALEQIQILDTKSTICNEKSVIQDENCNMNSKGSGLYLDYKAKVQFDTVRISNTEHLGLVLRNKSEFSGTKIELIDNTIGINYHNLSDDYDFNISVNELFMVNNNENYNYDDLWPSGVK